MAKFEESVVINRSPQEVFAYLSNLENDPPWSSATEIHKTSPGPIGIGTTFRQRDRFLGRHVDLHFEVVEYEMNHHIAMKADSGPLHLEGARIVEPSGDATTRVTFVGGGQAHGPLKILEPLLVTVGDRRLRSQLRKLKQLLEAPGQANI